jgi:parallel beta-helix repeat protein
MRLSHVTMAAAIVSALAAGAAPAGSATRPPAHTKVCSRFASPAGSDSAPATKTRPLKSVQALADSLAPGETGCLLSGTYVEDVSVRRGGSPGRPLTLRSAPGVTATVRGRFWIADSANWVTVAHLRLDGLNGTRLPSPTVNGDHATFTDDDVTNEHMGGVRGGDGVCFALGDPTGTYGLALYTTISYSKVHDCGTSNNHNHGIYVAGSDYATIVDNWIYDNADRGIQLYPDAQHTQIRNNVIARNGEGVIFSGDKTHASSDNQVINNVIIDSRTRYNVEYWWSGPVGTGNVVASNCVYGGREGNVLEPLVGYTASQNLIVAPTFVGRSWPSRIAPRSACAEFAPGFKRRR